MTIASAMAFSNSVIRKFLERGIQAMSQGLHDVISAA